MEHEATKDEIVVASYSEVQLPSSPPPSPCTPSDAECSSDAEFSFSSTDPIISGDHREARLLLVQQRKSAPEYRSPELQMRHIFRTKKRKELKSKEENWKFSKHEIAELFHSLLTQTPLPRSGLAKALLYHAQPTSIDELWCHLHDRKLENRMKRRFGRRSTSEPIPLITWLDTVTLQGNLGYIQLLCENRLGGDPINHAFGLALASKLSLIGIETLLEFGAIAFPFQDLVRGYVGRKDDAFVQLLLSYPAAMTVESWRYCMGPQLQGVNNDGEKEHPYILAMCLTKLSGVACGSMIIDALESQNVPAVELLLDSMSSGEDLTKIHERACQLACHIPDHTLRTDCFAILSQSQFLRDRLVLREELMRNIKARQLSLVRILVDTNVKLDVHPNDAMHLVASQLDLETLVILRDGNFSPPASRILQYVHESASEADVLRVIEILSPRGLEGQPLSWRLIIAVRKEQPQVVAKLLEYGASVEYERASAIKLALVHADSKILNMLISRSCSPEILSAAIPTAIALEPRPSRQRAMEVLLLKGLPMQQLRDPLHSLVCEDGVVDYELIQSLLQHRAPVDANGNDAIGPVTIAAVKGDLRLLRMLCKARPKPDTLSTAVPVALKLIHTLGFDVSIEAMKILLQHGARGIPVHQTLVASIDDDYDRNSKLRMVSLLLEHGADPNHATGASYVAAVGQSNLELLVTLCAACVPNQASLQSVLPIVIHPQHYSAGALEALLESSSYAAASINSCWASEAFRETLSDHPHLLEIVSYCFRHGMDVDVGDGIILCFAIQEVNFEVLERTLSASPNPASLENAFCVAKEIENRNVQLELLQLLLEQAGSAEIGQSGELFTETAIALDGDLAGLHLLLYHKAMVDYDDGKAVLLAAAEGSVDVLDLLLLARPAESTIKVACLLVAKVENLSLDQKLITLQHLLTANGGILAETASELLTESVVRLPEFGELPRLLLARGAIVEYAALETALETACSDLFLLLLQNADSRHSVLRLFRGIYRSTMQKDRKNWAYRCLLRKDIPVNDISEALLQSLTSDDNDLVLPKLFLHHGAAVDYAEYASFDLALKSKSRKTIRLLCSYLANETTAVVTAFDLVTQTNSSTKHVRAEAYRLLLLKGGISKASIQRALENNLAGENRDVDVVNLMLINGADPNKNKAKCFFTAIMAGAETEFQALAKYAYINPLLEALMGRFADERKIAHWFRICLKVKKDKLTLEELDQNDLTFRCMRKFPQGHLLLELLLEYRIIASDATIDHSICPGWPAERCTALIWALFSNEPRIENDAILALLIQGSKYGDGMYLCIILCYFRLC